LNDYEVTGQSVETDADGGHKLSVYRKGFKKGVIVSLGQNKGKYMYAVAVSPISTMEMQ